MADVITRLKVDSTEYDSKIKRATQGLLAMEAECRKMGGTLAILEKEDKAFVEGLGKMETVSKTAKGSLNELTQAYTELSIQYKRLTDEEKKGDFGKALSSSLEQLKGRIGEAKQQLKEVDAELGNTGKESNELGSIVSALAGKFGVSAEALTAFGVVAGTVTVALKVAKDAFMQSEGNIDSWGRTVEGAKGAYESFLASLNSDSWGNFFSNIEKAINGAMDLYDAIDRLNSVKSNNAAAIAYWRNEVQRLRVEKQNGKDVDLLLKSAEGNLKSLQSQGIQAGKTAGRQMINQTLTTAYNQQTGAGAGLSAAKQKEIADNMLMNGQKYFDEQKAIRDRLAKKADDSYKTIFGEKHYVNINKLTEAEKKQYLVAETVTEAETRLQKGINQYAQALSEEASANREEFKTNRYILQGSGGKGGGGGKTSAAGAAWAPIDMASIAMPGISFGRSISDIEKDISKYQKRYKEADDVGESLAAKSMMERYQRELEARKAMENPFADAYKHNFGKDIERLNKDQEKYAKKQEVTYSEQLKGIDQMVGGISAMVGSLQNIGVDIPEGFNKMLGGMQAILTVLEAIQTIDTVGSFLGLFSNGGVVHAAEGWSGVVPGSRFSGDQVPALLNSQELVLNTAQTGRLASALQGAQSGNVGTPYVDGEKIYLGVNNYLRRSGKGEIVTAR